MKTLWYQKINLFSEEKKMNIFYLPIYIIF